MNLSSNRQVPNSKTLNYPKTLFKVIFYLGDSIELSDEGSGSQVPQPQPLGGNVEQRVAVSL